MIELGGLPEDAWQRALKEREKSLRNCYETLMSYESAKIQLVNPTYFVPGWTAENSSIWSEEFPSSEECYKPLKHWIDRIIVNPEYARIVDLKEESQGSSSFVELGNRLKEKLVDHKENETISLVGHSMGGLDIRAAVLNDEKPVLKVRDFITLGAPNRGAFRAGYFKFDFFVQWFTKKEKPLTSDQLAQAKSMAMDSPDIREINQKKSWLTLTERIERFFIFMGLKDMAVQNTPEVDKEDIPEDIFKAKFKIIQTTGTEHTGRHGITQDPRIQLPVLSALCGLELKDEFNYGYVVREYGDI